MVGMKSHLQYNIFNDDAYPSEKISTRLHGRGVEITPHNFGTPWRYKNLYIEWIDGKDLPKTSLSFNGIDCISREKQNV